MYKKNESNLVNKIITVSVFLLSLQFLFPITLFAQGPSNDPNPCDFNGGVTSGSTTCPLDTWVWVLVAAAAILGTVKLYVLKTKQNQYS